MSSGTSERLMVYRLVGHDGESAAAADLWTAGCLGIVEERAADGRPLLLATFAGHVDLPYGGSWEEADSVDYVARYRAELTPVRVGHLVVAPSHATVTARDGDRLVWLDPGSAFGTGHHQTTAMALGALVGTPGTLAGMSVCDVGSGTGLLAIAADLLGARASYGVDVDPVAVVVARANAARNRSRARFALGSLEVRGLPSRLDVIVANLYAELHAELFETYTARLLPGGHAHLTGILASQRDVVTAAAPPGMHLVEERTAGEWLLLSYRREP